MHDENSFRIISILQKVIKTDGGLRIDLRCHTSPDFYIESDLNIMIFSKLV